MKTQTLPLAIVSAGLLVFMGFGVYWAGQEMGLMEGINWLLSNWWGKATIADLYISFAVIAGWIGFTERNKWVAGFWIINLFWAGSFVTLLVLLVRSLTANSIREVFVPASSQRIA